MIKALSSGGWLALALFLALQSLFASVQGAFVTFENCLPSSYTDTNPPRLQFTPYFVDATFIQDSTHNLSLTIYGNVSGQQFTGDYPPPDSPLWRDNQSALGKITNEGSGGAKLATLTADYTVLTFTAYDNGGEAFCGTLVNGSCPLGPYFSANRSDPYDLPAFFVTHDFGSSYSFSTIASTVHIISGDGPTVACVSAMITPDLGTNISGLLTWLPAAILILKGVATLAAAIWSPWGSSDIFRWSSNYGRDEDLLRLVTPGFGDCLQYIQFIVLTGSLTLNYPGFFQPAVSQASWSTLLFNESFVSGGNGTQSLVDGLYATNATYGLTTMSQLVGMSEASDIWACMAVWLLVIAAVVVLLCQLGFFGRWVYRMATHTTEEDLRQKNVPFTVGNIFRLLLNFFILPIVALSLFQLVVSTHSPASVIACAVVLLVIMMVCAAWILRMVWTTKPRTLLFDEMPTVLLYGPVYNTYSDDAATFALVPVLITFMRGVAIGAVQPSGIAQIIILAVCEVILILTLLGLRPFRGKTSMNFYHITFALVRLIAVLLMIAFVPTLGITEPPRGWIGYVILLLHACVLIFGFFLNSAQTLIEVIARSLGAGSDAQNGAVRGSILSWRMLKKRPDRPEPDRNSMMSNAAILRVSNGQDRSANYGGRSRSMSGSSQQLLNRMSGFENFSSAGEVVNSPDPGSENLASMTTGTGANGKPAVTAAGGADADPTYYRPPRRRPTMETAQNVPGTQTRSTYDVPYQDSPGHARESSYDSTGMHGSPAPAYIRGRMDSGDDNGPRTDYAVREVDQYYRGPPLSDEPSRKLKTGPADPTGPASTAQSWFSRVVFGVKGKKDQSKGFEVVRSSRMPPGTQQAGGPPEALELQQSPVMHEEPYRDSPETSQGEMQASAGAERSIDRDRSDTPTDDLAQRPPTTGFDFGFGSGNEGGGAARVRPDSETVPLDHPVLEPISTEHRASMGLMPAVRRVSEESVNSRESSHYPEEEVNITRYSDQPVPSLDPISTVGGIDLPSRFNSTATAASRAATNNAYASNTTRGGSDWLRAVDNLEWNHSRQSSQRSQAAPATRGPLHPAPTVPRRSSRRTLSQEVAAQRYQPTTENVFEGFDSNGTSPDLMRSPVDSPTAENGPPTGHSHHSVSHHRAADSISRNSIGANAAMQASSAEYFGQSPPQ
ncbi:hypothetical protein M409DRAFT_53116 [Zasmidium cellare ATCC 36951]|uniref:ML-like domain-containing protein n=1 Tax=Zasmidium cellare ATCC 36951 TaxID=1080233 RepID=A0A6A6CMH0_ZASCE|nr:uncharacterized protein M409DRAFT_53116 [Zasmidium cellare ATCC 36951]KAF2168437.1 hypothetical protein M409DRAFT_53116 [Zasmidium cellare ATCC 36951]